jgi:hypothetical protein
MLFAHLKRILRLDQLRLRGPLGAVMSSTSPPPRTSASSRSWSRCPRRHPPADAAGAGQPDPRSPDPNRRRPLETGHPRPFFNGIGPKRIAATAVPEGARLDGGETGLVEVERDERAVAGPIERGPDRDGLGGKAAVRERDRDWCAGAQLRGQVRPSPRPGTGDIARRRKSSRRQRRRRAAASADRR